MAKEFNDKLNCLILSTARQLNKDEQNTLNILHKMAEGIISLYKNEIIKDMDDNYDVLLKEAVEKYNARKP